MMQYLRGYPRREVIHMARNADQAEFDRALAGVEFPSSREGIVRAAADKGGLDNEVLFILENIRDRTYESAADVQGAIEDVYARTGGLDGGTPAARPEPKA
jgi:hypothetical protein